jgi:acyl-CoA synthetase (AMP-forming)/AMP-acid ligase II
MLIHHFLEESCQKLPDKEAVFFHDMRATYADIHILSNNIAHFLVSNGIRRSDRVAIIWENSINYIAIYYGILKAGAVVVSLNTELTPEGLMHLVNHCDASAIFCSSKFEALLFSIVNKKTNVKFSITESVQAPDSSRTVPSFSFLEIVKCNFTSPPSVSTINIDLSSIVYTSGSTGEPKGVMLSHLNIVENTNSIVSYLSLNSNDRMMVVLPFYYVYGKTLLNTHFSTGGSVVIENRFAYPNVVLKSMRDHLVTGFAGVPSTFMILLNKSALKQYAPFSHLRYVTQAGGSMPVPVQKQVIDSFAPAKLYIMYGSTELSPRLTWLPPEKWETKQGSIGIPIPNTDAFISDENGNRLPPEETGEIVGRGSNVMMGYWKDPVGTASVIKNGVYFTGDLGKMDKDGYIYVIGRSKDILKIGGNRVSAKEIEDAIIEIDAVEEVAVIGIEHPVLGEAARAFIVCKAQVPISAEEISSKLRKKLALYKIPSSYIFLESLPKNQAGKIQKMILKNFDQPK